MPARSMPLVAERSLLRHSRIPIPPTAFMITAGRVSSILTMACARPRSRRTQAKLLQHSRKRQNAKEPDNLTMLHRGSFQTGAGVGVSAAAPCEAQRLVRGCNARMWCNRKRRRGPDHRNRRRSCGCSRGRGKVYAEAAMGNGVFVCLNSRGARRTSGDGAGGKEFFNTAALAWVYRETQCERAKDN